MPRRSLVLLAAWGILGVRAGQTADQAGSPAEPRRNLIVNPAFEPDHAGRPAGWVAWSSRPELAPEATVVDSTDGRALSLRASRFPSFGKWITLVPAIDAGTTYLFEVLYQPKGVEHEDVSVAVILSWCQDENGATPVQRDYVDVTAAPGGWRRAARTLRAPARSRSLKVELGLRWTAAGSVVWRSPRLLEVDPPRRRLARVVTTRVVPPWPSTVEKNLELMAGILDRAGTQKPDLVVLSETLPAAGVDLPVTEVAQAIPGPATEMLGRKAKAYGTYVVTSLHERDGDRIYNTAVLIDRQGRIAGRYRKTHLAMIEGEDGITPGAEYPVFDADFGKVGMMICWDHWFPEPARILRLKGAELLVLPIAGDGDTKHWDITSRARAIDNGVYLVASSTVAQSPSRIVDPTGEVLAETLDPFGIAVSDIDLDREDRLHWLSVGPADGEARRLYIRERRPDTYGILSEGSRERPAAPPN